MCIVITSQLGVCEALKSKLQGKLRREVLSAA